MLTLLLYAFIGIAALQMGYYLLIFSRFPSKTNITQKHQYPPISVIVCAKNESDNLKQFIPYIIGQDYHQFEIVLINDSSTDDTLAVMHHLKSTNPNVKVVDVKPNEKFLSHKKFALTLGIKSATYEHLLFTDADCKPVSKNWLKEMSEGFTNQKSIVLGYGAHQKIKSSWLNKLIRFETLLTALQYFSYANIGMPYMGVGRNLAYTKSDFYNVNGFSNHMHIRSGDDDLLINQIANKNNTSLCINPDAFTISPPKTSFKSWFRQKRRHISTASFYRFRHKVLLGGFYVSQALFWLLGLLFLTIQFKPIISMPIFLSVLFVKYIVIGLAAKKLKEQDVILIYPFLELTLIVSQFLIFMVNLFSKPKHWS
jgi:glycosyltransferase involved in cell wall biosynthesis